MPERDDWDCHWNRYAIAANQNPAQQMRHAIVARLLLRSGDGRAAQILDIGSGQGDLLGKLRTLMPSARLMGVELSRSGVAISREKVPDCQFIAADLFHPPADLSAYLGWATSAVCSEVLEHIDSPEAFLRAARPYLAGNARLIVTVPGGPMSAFDRSIGHRRHFTRTSIDRVIRDAGFEVERVTLSGFPFFNLYRAVVIARGDRLANDIASEQNSGSTRLATAAMALFRVLLRWNLPDSPFGWQVIAVARNPAPSARQ